jgi:hypothetical protein
MGLEPVEESDLKPVRVRVRQLDYITKGTNPLGQEIDVVRTAYGPGDQRLNPAERTDIEPGSQAAADAVSDYKNGQLILLRPQQYIGLIAAGAVRDVKMSKQTVTDEEGAEYEEEVEEVEEEEQLLDVNTASVDDLILWIQQERPTVNDVVQASGGDPDVARKLLEAESKATDGEPRKGVTEGLSAVISRG